MLIKNRENKKIKPTNKSNSISGFIIIESIATIRNINYIVHII